MTLIPILAGAAVLFALSPLRKARVSKYTIVYDGEKTDSISTFKGEAFAIRFKDPGVELASKPDFLKTVQRDFEPTHRYFVFAAKRDGHGVVKFNTPEGQRDVTVKT